MADILAKGGQVRSGITLIALNKISLEFVPKYTAEKAFLGRIISDFRETNNYVT